MDQIVNGLESQFTIAVFISGALALLIVAAVGFAWWRGRHWVNRSRASMATARHSTLFSQADDPPPVRPTVGASGDADEPPPGRPAAGSTGGVEAFGSRLVREAAARTASLRDAWDRSYRETRGSETAQTPAASMPATDLPARMDELLREQRETNALLRQLVERLGQSDR